MQVRAATPDDYQAMVQLSTRRSTHESSAEAGWMLEVPETWPDLVALLACSDDGSVLGHAKMASGTHMAAGRTVVSVTVLAEHEHRGAGSALWAALLERRPDDATQLRSAVFDDEERSLQIARHWGFEVEELSISSAVSLVGTRPPQPPVDVTLDSSTDDNYPDRAAVEAMLLASRTSPEALAGAVLDLDRLKKAMQGSDPVQVVARVDGVPAAIASGSVYDGQLNVMYTGVDPRFRGRGLALLVKQQAHHDAARLGATGSATTNEVGNTGIRGINARLGYQVLHGTYRLRRDL